MICQIGHSKNSSIGELDFRELTFREVIFGEIAIERNTLSESCFLVN